MTEAEKVSMKIVFKTFIFWRELSEFRTIFSLVFKIVHMLKKYFG